MAWFKKAKKPKAVREDQRQRSSVPEGLWVKCDGCKEIIYAKELERNLRICPKCGHHFRIDAPVAKVLKLTRKLPPPMAALMDAAPPEEPSSAERYFQEASVLDDGDPQHVEQALRAYRRAL